MPYSARLSFGTILKLGDGGAGAAKASYTHGSSNQQIVFEAVAAGTGGNSITVEIINNASLSVSTTGNAVTINADVAAHSVNAVIAAIYADATTKALINATDGAGDGTGLITALTSTALTGGTDSAEVFSPIPGVSNFNISGPTREEVDVTNHSSSQGAIETLPEGVYDPGSITFDLFYDASDATHQSLLTEFNNKTISNYQIAYPADVGVTKQFTGWVKSFGNESAPVRGAATRSVEIRITGPVTDV